MKLQNQRKENVIKELIRENPFIMIIENNAHRSGPTQFKPTLFKGQLYIYTLLDYFNICFEHFYYGNVAEKCTKHKD